MTDRLRPCQCYMLHENLVVLILCFLTLLRLPGDRRTERRITSNSHTVDEMMELIKNHIWDLEMVNTRVRDSCHAGRYNMGLNSQKSGF